MRKGASRFFGVILIGLLVVSFGVWGIADIFTGYGSQTLVKVGDTEVNRDDYLQVQREVLQGMSGQAGRTMSLQEARAQGLDAQVLERLVGGAALDTHAQDLGLGISDDKLLEEIMKDPGLQDDAGNFNGAMLQQYLAQMGMSEQTFLEIQRERNLRRQILSTLGQTVATPDLLIDALDTYNNQTRTLRYVLVPESAVDASPDPTETDLKSFYDNHQAEFTQPEYRTIGVIAVSPETVKDQVEISEKELKDEYEANKAEYDTPEKRHVYQISFANTEDAKKAYDEIKGGKDFLEVAKAGGMKESDVDLGVLTRTGMVDPVLAEAAFKLEDGGVSEPVTGKLGAIALLHVSNIIPGKEASFDKVKPEIEKKILASRAESVIFDTHDRIEDERASGATLEEVAEKLDLPYKEIEKVDAQGNTASGVQPEIPQKQKLLQEAFASDVGVENDPVDAGDEGFVWYDVVDITPQRVRPFEEVKTEVGRMWRQDDRQKRLAEYTAKLVTELDKGEATLADIAKKHEEDVVTTQPLKRSGMALNVLPQAVAQAFSLPDKAYGSAEAGVQGARILFQVAEVTPPKALDGPARAELERQLKVFISDDILSQYFGALQDRYQVSVNHEAINRLTGAEQQ
ncbi:Peptidyl-prolyl cis-trans isomerase D [Methyloligella halotolerans]|uniref:Parvulin-like PPIase n=2 Tax=Methyloligella halotolerans TaxID=1177755 RepID=A0A1E2S251_9HYPH|nr:Peptidyl-prolyl cis-trans isomerase D [Methyloligella halotolerans]